MTSRAQVLALLHQHRESLQRDFAVESLAIFGSAARDDLRPESDVDILVDFSGPATFDRYFGLKDRLKATLGRPVDLVTSKGLKPRARQQVEQDLVRVA
ncbi:MAG: DNA polymerase subunit beta [Methylibium sp. NZG]|nr:MAG: DNA polymerase subunit beta [Methylibium sp. NZG]